ncbi:MAG: acyl-CoA reductase [Flavobacteriales bacterium]|jgi:hypothetical protein|nr:acyl-CoA reductase [Flavobacteriales bacterium]
MNLQARIQAFSQLGEYLKIDIFQEAAEQLYLAEVLNPWFTKENIASVLRAWQEQLSANMLTAWLSPYKLKEVASPKKVLIIMAGNIPLVGFHDFLTVLISGHKVVVKMSSTDNVLLKVLIEKLISIAPEFKDSISFIDVVKNRKFDAIIATGSDNSAQYFEYYFKGAKKIIRKNRRSVAVLDGSESAMDLKGLAVDVFAYFGLGCRNVSKLFLPKGYELNKLFDAFFSYSHVVEHKKYGNNYDYNKAIFLMGSNKLVENGFLLMKEDKSLLSPVAMLYYEYYDDVDTVEQFVEKNAEQLQCVVSKKDTPFGNTQQPNLWDYADGVDTVDFLREL